jgi:hypothetical protein
MSYEEMLDAVTTLQGEREGLRNEAIREKKKAVETGVPTPKAPKAPRVAKADDPFLVDIMKMLEGSKKK